MLLRLPRGDSELVVGDMTVSSGEKSGLKIQLGGFTLSVKARKQELTPMSEGIRLVCQGRMRIIK